MPHNLASFAAQAVEIKMIGPRTQAQRRHLWRQMERLRAPFLLRFQRLAAQALRSQLEEVTQRLVMAPRPNRLPGMLPTQLRETRPLIEGFFRDAYQMAAPEFARAVFEALHEKAGWLPSQRKQDASLFTDLWLELALQYVKTTALKKVSAVQGVILAETTAIMEGLLEQALEQGWGVGKIVAEFNKQYKDFIPGKAEVWARTEIIAASNYGSLQGAKSTGLPLDKEWIATADDRTRDSHSSADGQRVNQDAPFEVGGEQLQFPGDTSLGAGGHNVIQCRCTLGYHVRP